MNSVAYRILKEMKVKSFGIGIALLSVLFIQSAEAFRYMDLEGRFLISTDYLLMRMQQDNISYGTKYTTAGTSSSSFTETRTAESDLYFPFNYESGFRILLGWEDPCALWGIKASYDFLYGSYNDLHIEYGTFIDPLSLGNHLMPAFGNRANLPLVQNSSQRLEASWRGRFNQLDLYVDRKFECFRYLGINLLLGVRFVSIGQDLFSNYEIAGSSNNFVYNQGANQKDYLKSQFCGAGAFTGVQLNWFLWEGLYFFGFLKGALVGSKTTFTLNSTEPQLLIDYALFTQNKKVVNEGIKAALDLGVGLNYSLSFCQDAYTICFHTAFEQHQWFNQNSFRSALTSLRVADQQNQPLSGDFSLYGWVFGLDLLF